MLPRAFSTSPDKPLRKEPEMKRHVYTVVIGVVLATVAVAQPPERGGFAPGAPASGSEYGPFPGGPGGPAGPPPNAMFEAIDTDGDGTITMRELRKAVVALKKLDANKDGKITLAETMPTPGGLGSGGPAGFGSRTGIGNGPASGFSGDPRPVGPDLMQYDRNGDGQLSPNEVPTQMMGLVRGSDQNGDGKLDARELQAIQQRMNERVRGQRALPPGISVGPQGVERSPKTP